MEEIPISRRRVVMKALEFEARVRPDHTLSVPSSVAPLVSPGQPVRVLLLVPDSTEDADWESLAATEFLTGYAGSDAIYAKECGFVKSEVDHERRQQPSR
jgi:hypothetical protein